LIPFGDKFSNPEAFPFLSAFIIPLWMLWSIMVTFSLPKESWWSVDLRKSADPNLFTLATVSSDQPTKIRLTTSELIEI
jgi:hypothetical protein